MIDPEINKEIFPFYCGSDNCKKCYGIESFFTISSDFGFIFLSNGEYNLFGFTCPECKTTTVRKYILNTNIPDIPHRKQFNYFIPFCSDKIVELCEHDLKCNLFRLPQQVTLLHSLDDFEIEKIPRYTDSFLKKCLLSFCEKDISSILTYENLNKKCLFPRIFSEHSVYSRTERFMYYIEDEGYANLDDDCVVDTFTGFMEGIADRFLYPQLINSIFTIEEYRDLTMKYSSIISSFPPEYDGETAICFLKEYKEQRNDFDFQVTCIRGLFYKYIKKLYYLKGYFRSELYFKRKDEYEDAFGKVFKGGTKNMTCVDDPYNHEILTAKEVADRWGRDVNIVKSFIMKRELPAYDHEGVWFRIGTPENKDIVIDLQNYVFLKSEVEQLEVLTPWLNPKKQGKKNELKVEQPVQKQSPSTVDTIECQKNAIESRHERRKIKRDANENEHHRDRVREAEKCFPGVEIISCDSEIDDLKIWISQLSKVDTDRKAFLLLGERGTGKGVFAEAFHKASGRKGGIIKIDCGDREDTLFKSELFGHVKGAFTGADKDHKGALEEAGKGTIFIDEIGNLSMSLQAALLGFLQTWKFQPLGEQKTTEVNAMVVLATNKDLEVEIKNGNFRADLYDRISSFKNIIPPLRNRKDDIPILLHHFIKKHDSKKGKDPSLEEFTVTSDCINALMNFDWPGNVRQLEGVVEYIIMTRTMRNNRSQIDVSDLPYWLFSDSNYEDKVHPKSDKSTSIGKSQYGHLPKDDTILTQHKQDGMTNKAIAEKYNVDPATVSRRLSEINKKAQN